MATERESQIFQHSHDQAAAVHQALRENPGMLSRLKFDGIQRGIGNTYYQLRSCPGCGSTVNAEVSAEQAIVMLAEVATAVARTLSQFEAFPAPTASAP